MERYEKMEELGRGAYGVVCKAFDRKTGEIVAIKKLITQKYYTKEECMNEIEVRSLFKMNNHPNIVKLKEFVVENNILFLVFEYMECSLYKRMVKRTNPFSEAEIKDLCFQLFQGLAYMHYNGYIHRDIKPQNLLVMKDIIKIGDFGQAREIDDKLPYTDYVTTRWYRAPEVLLRAKIYDFAIDMWAMGAIMVELFNLEPLFKGDTETAVMHKICSVLGTPTETKWGSGLNLASKINYQFPKFSGVRFSELLATASPDAVNLIASLLTWHPCLRPTVMDVLHHPFFDSCYYVPRPVLQHERVGIESPLITGENTFEITMQQSY